MPNFNPFNLDHEDTSFEQGMPVTQAAKNISKAAKQQADDAIKKANDEIVAELYGSSTPSEPGTDETNVQHSDASNAATRAAATHATAGGHTGKSSSANTNANQTPDEQAKMEKIRHELFGNYSAKFQSAQNGAQPLNTNLEMAMEKARKEREEREMQRKREEEEEEQRKKEEEEQQKQELDMPAGKKTGMMFGKKQQEPIALRLAKTKAEINRGQTG